MNVEITKFAPTLFRQKFCETETMYSKGTTEVTKEMIARNILSIGVIFMLFHTVVW